MPYTLIIDIAVAVLLVVTIAYASDTQQAVCTRLRRGQERTLESLAQVRLVSRRSVRRRTSISLRTVAQALGHPNGSRAVPSGMILRFLDGSRRL